MCLTLQMYVFYVIIHFYEYRVKFTNMIKNDFVKCEDTYFNFDSKMDVIELNHKYSLSLYNFGVLNISFFFSILSNTIKNATNMCSTYVCTYYNTYVYSFTLKKKRNKK